LKISYLTLKEENKERNDVMNGVRMVYGGSSKQSHTQGLEKEVQGQGSQDLR
jgi:hypothetical protein